VELFYLIIDTNFLNQFPQAIKWFISFLDVLLVAGFFASFSGLYLIKRESALTPPDSSGSSDVSMS
jgi:hypothetical protein